MKKVSKLKTHFSCLLGKWESSEGGDGKKVGKLTRKATDRIKIDLNDLAGFDVIKKNTLLITESNRIASIYNFNY